jgi:hypothetical protein
LTGGGLVGLAGCSDNQPRNGSVTDPSPTESEPEDPETPTDEPSPDSRPSVVRLSPVEDPREVWRTGLTAIYPTDLIRWLEEVASHDRLVEKRVSTGHEMPDPPLQVLGSIRFVELPDAPFIEDAGSITGYYELDVEAGPYYEMILGAEQVTPPSDAEVTPVTDLEGERREVVVAALEDDTERSRVYSDTELAEWARNSFIDTYYRYEGNTYRGYEIQRTNAASSSTEAWYRLSATPSREYDDATYLLLPNLVESIRAELDAAGVRERTDELVVEDPSESLVAFADRMSMLVTHVTIFRMHVEAR